MDNDYIKIYEIENYNFEKNVWIIEVLKENNIPYETKIEEYWIGNRIRKYMKKLCIFIPKEYEDKVKEYIEEYQNPKSIVGENIPELKSENDKENEEQAKRVNKVKKTGVILFLAFLILLMIIVIISNFI